MKTKEKQENIDFAKEVIEIAEEVELLDIEKLQYSTVKRMFKDEAGYFGEMENQVPEGKEIIKDEWDMGKAINTSAE